MEDFEECIEKKYVIKTQIPEILTKLELQPYRSETAPRVQQALDEASHSQEKKSDSLLEAVTQDCNSENRPPRKLLKHYRKPNKTLKKGLPKQANGITPEMKLCKKVGKRSRKKPPKKPRKSVQNRMNTITQIKLAPRHYIGIPSSCYFVVDLIAAKDKVREEYILLCLKKIRLNTSFQKLSYEFGIFGASRTYKIFSQTVVIIANSISHFIRILRENKANETNEIKLPIYKSKYHCQRATCIIDCFEIELQKPLEVSNDNMTLSESRGANVIKYLISCTCDGLVDYVSQGYVGSVSDELLVNYCNYLHLIESGKCFLGDCGLKDIERPKEVKQIARLKFHMNRILQGIGDFAILDSQSAIDTNLLTILDEIMVIVCALLNIDYCF